ncbi:MAG: pyrroline-5-carboxylate reductase [Candidatus Eremiobacter antarcticus]|nr:pyrroline-5-carboxylate reductase [Candidatus Eremiobacteraeota bacterium]PZR60887.1 MAG: pyrroline-5-carboxylate reductase [Candidatus Eremiobacter sp. RRmetagenome_bin22]
MRIAVIGCGQIGEALIRGMLAAQFTSREEVIASSRTESRSNDLKQSLGIKATTDNHLALDGAAIVVITLKPSMVGPILSSVGTKIAKDALVISVAAGVSTSDIEACVGRISVVRAMPNLPVIIRQGITCLARGRHASSEQLQLASDLFSSVGRVMVVQEQHMDAVTGLSGSGPAFVFMVIESMAEGGVNVGLPRAVALELAAQTTAGAGAMVVQTGEHPAKLKDEVTTPAGCTVDGIMQLEEGGLRVALIKAVSRAAVRAKGLAGRES